MSIVEIESKTLLRKHRKVDSWFLTKYGMNIYRGCSHNCIYCDGQAEKYHVIGDFESEIEVKINAPHLLRKALDRLAKKRTKPGFIGIVGGVSDAYQPIEKDYKITRQVLEILQEKKYPVMALTKSTLIERDIDLLKKINKKARYIKIIAKNSGNCPDWHKGAGEKSWIFADEIVVE